MADISTERISFEAALAALLAAYQIEGSGGDGIITDATRLTLINLTKAKLDEVIPEGEGLQFEVEGDINVSDPLNMLINAILDEAAKRTLLNCPKHYLDPVKSTATATAGSPDTKIGYIVLPSNFLRFVSLKMADWQRQVNEITPVESQEYLMQFNPYVRGGVAKPKAAITHRSIGESSTITTTTTISNYGGLYNWHSVNNAKNLAAANAHVPTMAEWNALIAAHGGAAVATPKLKEAGMLHWNSPNNGTNETGLSIVGSGVRGGWGAQYFGIKNYCYMWASDGDSSDHAYMQRMTFNDPIEEVEVWKIDGLSVRLIVDTPISPSGGFGTYLGNDGKQYSCKLMADGKYWLQSHLAETKYRTGDEIPLIPLSQDASWKTDAVGAMCYYDDDINNGLTTTTTTTTTNTLTQARVLEYFSVNYSHVIDWLFYIQETKAENVQRNLWDALTWVAAAMVLQITERVDLANEAFKRELESYVKPTV